MPYSRQVKLAYLKGILEGRITPKPLPATLIEHLKQEVSKQDPGTRLYWVNGQPVTAEQYYQDLAVFEELIPESQRIHLIVDETDPTGQSHPKFEMHFIEH